MIGLGIDVAETERIKRLLDKHGQRFIKQVLSTREQQLIRADGEVAPRRLLTFVAGRWCAKEAIMKVLGIGLGEVDIRQIEVLRAANGAATVELSGTALLQANSKGISAWHLSISHERLVTVAVAVAL